MKPLTGKELASEIHKLYAEIREKSKLADAQMKEISRLQVLASKQVAEIHAKEMLIRSLTRGKREQDAEIAQLKDVISKGTDMKVELLKENAKLKELVKELLKFMMSCRIRSIGGFTRKCDKIFAKAKQALGED